jgi:glycerol uptake facilitator-like aquaporin
VPGASDRRKWLQMAEMTFSAVEDAHEPLSRKYREIVHQTQLWYPSGIARKHISAEFIGSFLLQFLRGCAVVNSVDLTLNGTAYASHHGQSGLLISALGAGFSYAALLYATAGENGSGGKLNPAISTALFVSRRTDPKTFVAEVLAQFSGAMIGSVFVFLCIPSDFLYFSNDRPLFQLEGAKTTLEILRGMFTEFTMTAMLVMIYIATAEDFHNRVYTKSMWPLAVGLAMSAGMLGGNNSGGAMNPASGFAASLAYWQLRNLPAYLLASVSGAVFGALVYLKLLGNDLNDAPLRPNSVFEGVRQEKREFGNQNFIMYLVLDFVHDRLSSDPFETRFSGRVCYPQMYNAVSQIEGMVTNDGKVLRITEIGEPFHQAQIQGYMPDTGHMAGIQVHANGKQLAYIAVTLVGPKMAKRVIDQIDSLKEPPAREPTPPPEPKRHTLQLC